MSMSSRHPDRCLSLIPLLALAFFAIVVSPTATSGATTHHVDDDACPLMGSGTEQDPFCSIQAAISAAMDGDTVLVHPGIYAGGIDFLGKAIHVRADSVEPTDTQIDGSTTGGPVVVFQNGEGTGSILEGFCIVNGTGRFIVNGTYGGGILCIGSSPTIVANRFEANQSLFGGGLAALDGSSPIVRDNLFHQNGLAGCQSGAGAYLEQSPAALFEGNLFRENISGKEGSGISFIASRGGIVRNNHFLRNNSRRYTAIGGAITAMNESSVDIIDNVFDGNFGEGRANSIGIEDSIVVAIGNEIRNGDQHAAAIDLRGTSSAAFEDNLIERMRGRAIVCQQEGTVTFIRNTIRSCSYGGSINDMSAPAILGFRCGTLIIEDNQILNNAGTYQAGAIGLYETSAEVRGNIITNNRSNTDGGGLSIFASDVVLSGNTLAANVARRNGGGIYGVLGEITLDACTISRNIAQEHGGGLYLFKPILTLRSTMLTENRSTADGGGIYLNDVTVEAAHLTITGNEATTGEGGGLFVKEGEATAIFANSILWGNEASSASQVRDDSASLHLVHSCIENGFPGQGNIDLDPLFVNPENGDYHLRFESPLVDAGYDAVPWQPTTDHEGDARVVDGDLDGAAGVDIGADELLPEIAARYGGVNAASGSLANVLTVNGQAGDQRRIVDISSYSEPVSFDMVASPAGPEPGKFVLYLWLSEPDLTTITPHPRRLGMMSHPTPLAGSPIGQPIHVWNNLGYEPHLGVATLPSTPAPSNVWARPGGIRRNLTITLQGFLLDNGSVARQPASITNAVVIRIGT